MISIFTSNIRRNIFPALHLHASLEGFSGSGCRVYALAEDQWRKLGLCIQPYALSTNMTGVQGVGDQSFLSHVRERFWQHRVHMSLLYHPCIC